MLADGDAGALSVPQAQMVSMIDRNSHRLLAQIENLLDISRIQSGRVASRPVPTDLPRLIAGAIDAMRPVAEAASVSLQSTVAPDLGELTVDPGQLDRVIVNLLSNAVKFTPAGGTVTLVANRDGAEIELAVEDTGIGIPAEEQPRLFDRFFRASTAEQRAIPGSGLGLAIVKEIVEAHHGTVSVDSRPEHGTRFTLRLPADPPTDSHAATAAA
jgi:signal transduction histidine kinase